MELELGLKITKNVNDVCSDFRFAKDKGGTIFVSSETETMFILSAHLRGYRRENIKIDINEDATLITISGEKPVQEMVLKGLMMHKKEIEIKRFVKVFQIPYGVILDQVKAMFNEIDSTLTIYMPKLIKGIIGSNVIQEIRDQKISNDVEEECNEVLCTTKSHNQVLEKAVFASEKREGDEEEASTSRELQDECSNTKDDGHKIEEICEENEEVSYDNRHGKAKKDCQREENEARSKNDDQIEMERNDGKCSSLFSPCLFIGGAFFASLLVLVCSFVRFKKR